MKERTKEHLDTFLERYKELAHLEKDIISAVEAICDAAGHERTVLVCGNGGSAADSEHIAGEFLKSFVLRRKIESGFEEKLIDYCGAEVGELLTNNLQQGIRCIPLTAFSGFNSAYLNDCDPNVAFAQLVNVIGKEGDVLIAISTSGNAKNVCYAAMVARTMGIKVIALTGEDGGELKKHADILLNVPSKITYQIQEYHLPVYHSICLMAENEMFEELVSVNLLRDNLVKLK